MSWTMTLEVVDCGATNTFLSGADVRLGLLNIGVTDAGGRISATIDDFTTLPIFKISKTDYVANNFVFDKAVHANTVQQVCLVNPGTIPDGHDPNVGGASGGQEFGGGGCFIVTATTGSPDSTELVQLRALRDRVSTISPLGSKFIEAIYAEYAQFSPAIANELASDDTARELVLDMVVRPLLAWYTLAGDLGLNPQNHNHDTAARNVTDACPPQYEELMLGLLQSVHTDAQSPDTPLNDLTPHAADYPLAAWALLDPLTRAWHAHRDHLDITEQIAQWLATAPLEQLDLTMSTETFQRELETLTGFLTFNPQQQQRMHNRLTTAHPAN